MTMLLACLYFVCNVLFVVQGILPLNLEQQIKLHGYPVETHQVITNDDYILNMYRIPRGLGTTEYNPKNKSAVLLTHGQGGSPHNFIALGRKYAAAYYFADRGFDVWLFCARGAECHGPKKHKFLDWNKDPVYWNFSMHDIAIYDLPASIDLILNKTGQKKIFYVGHSSGGPQFFALMSEKPKYNEKIKINANYAPMAILKEMDYPFLQFTGILSNIMKNLYRAMDMYEFLPPFLGEMIFDALRKICIQQKSVKTCKLALWCSGSHNSTLMEDEVVEAAISVTPRLSMKQVTHFMDNMNKGDFRKYDYGPKNNLAIYGTKLPPTYNMTACTAANAFFYGATDSLNVKEDVWATEEMLPNTILDYEVGRKFVHLDFIFAKNASHMVYQPTVKLFQDFDAGVIPPRVTRDTRNTKKECC